jgi:serine protease Do
MSLAPITPDVRMQTGLPKSARGLLVTDVDPNGEAAKRGIQPGDRIVEAGGQAVDSIKALRSAIDAARSDRKKFVLLKVQRRDVAQFIAVPTQ